jgi:hypothetical protein
VVFTVRLKQTAIYVTIHKNIAHVVAHPTKTIEARLGISTVPRKANENSSPMAIVYTSVAY